MYKYTIADLLLQNPNICTRDLFADSFANISLSDEITQISFEPIFSELCEPLSDCSEYCSQRLLQTIIGYTIRIFIIGKKEIVFVKPL